MSYDIHIKQNNNYEQLQNVYIKQNGVYQELQGIYIKNNSEYKMLYNYNNYLVYSANSTIFDNTNISGIDLSNTKIE